MMISDDERREVARRLRELDYSDLQESLICAYLDALGIEGYEDWVGIAHHLADLIEPSIPSDPGEAGLASVEGFIGEMRHSTKEEQDLYDGMLEKMSVEIHPVDRDALLRLAKSLDAQAECRIKSNDIIAKRGDRSRNMAIAKDLFGIACEIRNALGVKS